MKHFILLASLVLSACAPSGQAIQTALTQTQIAAPDDLALILTGNAPTQMAIPTLPAPTEAPTPTKMPAPTVPAKPTATPKITADTSTWPAGFAEAAGEQLTYQIQVVLMDPEKYGFWQQDTNRLEAMKLEHPEWKDFIDYLLEKGWTY